MCVRFRPGDWAWVGIGAVVVTYEAYAAGRRGHVELLSEACDRYRKGHPFLTHLTVLYLAGHLTRRWPAKLDPLHRMAERFKP